MLDAMRSAPGAMSLLAERTIEEAKAKGVLVHRDIYAVRLELAAAGQPAPAAPLMVASH